MRALLRIVLALYLLAVIAFVGVLHVQRSGGREAGARTSSWKCVGMASERQQALAPTSELASRWASRAWLEGCLQSAWHSDEVCEDLEDVEAWEAETCRRGAGPRLPCIEFNEVVSEHCADQEGRRQEASAADEAELRAAVDEARRQDPLGRDLEAALEVLASHHLARQEIVGAALAYRDLARLQSSRAGGRDGAGRHALQRAGLIVLSELGPRAPVAMSLVMESVRAGAGEGGAAGITRNVILAEPDIEAWLGLPDELRRIGEDPSAFDAELEAFYLERGRSGPVGAGHAQALFALGLALPLPSDRLASRVTTILAGLPEGLSPDPHELQRALFDLADRHGDEAQRRALLVGAMNAWKHRPEVQTRLFQRRVRPHRGDDALRAALDRGLRADAGERCSELEAGLRSKFHFDGDERRTRVFLELRTRDLRIQGCTVHAFWLQDYVLGAVPGIPAAI